MLILKAEEKKCIDLGRRGEDCARKVLFDISGWAELYGQGKAQVVAKRDKDLNSYPVEVTQNDTTVSWVITSVDTDQPGYGQCELIYITDGSVVKSIVYQTHTDISLSDPISLPDSPDIYGDVLRKLEELEDIVDDSVVVKDKAIIGQTVRVKSVDENGNITEWEVTDFPKGSVMTVNEVSPDENGNVALDIESTVVETMIALNVAPVILDDGAILTDFDNSILLNM